MILCICYTVSLPRLLMSVSGKGGPVRCWMGLVLSKWIGDGFGVFLYGFAEMLVSPSASHSRCLLMMVCLCVHMALVKSWLLRQK